MPPISFPIKCISCLILLIFSVKCHKEKGKLDCKDEKNEIQDEKLLSTSGLIPDEPLKIPTFNDFENERQSTNHQDELILPLKDGEIKRIMRTIRNSHAKPPIFLVPGLGSTRLTAWKQKSCRYTSINIKDNVWLNAGKLLETLSIDPHCWVDCLKLGPNQTDPEGCKVRPEEGLGAISVLSPGPIIGGVTAVYSWLIDYLAENMGYDPNSILAFPYDWRLSPNKMEERDGFFTKFKFRIEESVQRLGRPGIFIGHSMANLVLFYFLEWLKSLSSGERGGRSYEEWVNDHIWMQVGLGAPLLGAAEPLKSVISGEDMGLKITDEQARVLEASFGSTNLLNPRSTKKNFTDDTHCHQPWAGTDWQEDIVTILSDKGAGATLQFDVNAISNGELFRWIGNIFDDSWLTEKYLSLHQDFYQQKIYSISRPPPRPPIKHVLMVYGVNVPTANGLIYLNKKGNTRPTLDERIIEDGGKIWAEKYKKTTGKTDRRFLHNSSFPKSGDGTVPYISLSWALTWMFEGSYEVEQHPSKLIPASKSQFLQWAPEKISDVVTKSTLLPGFEVHKSTDNTTGRDTIVIEIEGLEHKDNTKDIFTITTLFEYILPKIEEEMCLDNEQDHAKQCTSSFNQKGLNRSLKNKENVLTSMFKEFFHSKIHENSDVKGNMLTSMFKEFFQSKINQYDEFFGRTKITDEQ